MSPPHQSPSVCGWRLSTAVYLEGCDDWCCGRSGFGCVVAPRGVGCCVDSGFGGVWRLKGEAVGADNESRDRDHDRADHARADHARADHARADWVYDRPEGVNSAEDELRYHHDDPNGSRQGQILHSGWGRRTNNVGPNADVSRSARKFASTMGLRRHADRRFASVVVGRLWRTGRAACRRWSSDGRRAIRETPRHNAAPVTPWRTTHGDSASGRFCSLFRAED